MTEITAILVSMRLPFFGVLGFLPRLKKDLLKKQIENNVEEVFYHHKREFERISLAFAINSYFYAHTHSSATSWGKNQTMTAELH